MDALRGASFGEGTGRIWLDNVECTGNETELSSCIAISSDVNCTHAQDAGVRCSPGSHNNNIYAAINANVLSFCSGCPEGDVRLLEGNTKLEGRVEICKENSWGLVCQNSWSTSDARVVCRQLGFSTIGMCHSHSSFHHTLWGCMNEQKLKL